MPIVATTNSGKQFEKPNSGAFYGVLADIVDLGNVTTTYQGQTRTQHMVRFIWILNKNGTDNKPLTVAQRYNLNLHEKSNLYKTVKQILGSAPPATYDLEQLLGKTRQLFIQRDKSPDGSKDFANIIGIAPAPEGAVVPVPVDFVRAKNRPAKNQQASAPVQQQVQQQDQGADVGF